MEMLNFENAALAAGYCKIAGCDEAGRGCLAGPVVAAAVTINPSKFYLLQGVFDSKQLSEKKRLVLFEQILLHAHCAIGIIEASEIDEINIYAASRKAMEIALSNLDVDYVLTDAMPITTLAIPVIPIIKGDQKSILIAAASIIAKSVRDSIMKEYGIKYPDYFFEKHKGYPTKKHKEALEKNGVIRGLYRETYAPVKKMLEK